MNVTACKDIKRHIDRVRALECMDYLVSCMNDERLDMFWCMHGLPDDHTDDDLHDIAEDDTRFGWVCDAFLAVMGSDEALNGGFAI